MSFSPGANEMPLDLSYVIYFSGHSEKQSHQRFPSMAQAWDYARTQYGQTVLWMVGQSSEAPTHTYCEGKLLRTTQVM